MRRLLLFYLIIQIVRGSCPDGFDLVGSGQCRELDPVYSASSFQLSTAADVAISKCKEKDAQPVIIRNDEEQEYWKNKNKYYIPLGLVCNTTSKRWQWVDGSVRDYTPPKGTYSSELTDDCKEGCSWTIWTGHNGNEGNWLLYCSGSSSTLDIFCMTQLHQPVLPAEGCYNFEEDSDNNMCYQIGTTAESWQDAQMICKDLGADLASVHNVNENSFIRRLAVSKGAVHGVFLGATVSGKGGNYGWIDGSDWDYENFYQGFPMAGFGDCIALDTSVSSGQWMNVECAAKLPVACIRQQKAEIQWNATCNVQSYQEGVIITSPGFPFNASVPCEYYLEVDAGKRVEVEIALLEANSCCDYLTLYDGYFGGYVLANLTGAMQNVTYTTTDANIMRVSWQPNGGVNVRGMALTFRGV